MVLDSNLRYLKKVIKQIYFDKDINDAIEFFLKNYKKRKRIDRTHDIDHFIRVIKLASKIIKEENLALNENERKALALSILFHDIGLFFIEKPKDIELSVGLFLEFSKKVKLPKNIKDTVIKAIEEHSFKRNKKASSLISKILYDADKLDVIGAIFAYRTSVFSYKFLLDFNKKDIYLKHINNLTKEDINKFDDKNYIIDHYYTKAIWIKDRLYFNFSKKEFDKRIERTKRWIKEIIDES